MFGVHGSNFHEIHKYSLTLLRDFLYRILLKYEPEIWKFLLEIYLICKVNYDFHWDDFHETVSRQLFKWILL
jgi:hypothetical protein